MIELALADVPTQVVNLVAVVGVRVCDSFATADSLATAWQKPGNFHSSVTDWNCLVIVWGC